VFQNSSKIISALFSVTSGFHYFNFKCQGHK